MTEVLDKETGEIHEIDDGDEETIAAQMTPEEDDDEENDDDEDETEGASTVDVQAAESQAEMEKAFKKLDAAVGRYRPYVEEFIAATEQPLVPCGLCLDASPGYFLHPEAVKLSDNQEMFVRSILGIAQPKELLQDDESQTCERCGGEGRVETGSKVEKWKTLKCRHCDGRGAIGKRFIGMVSAPGSTEAPTPPADDVPSQEAPRVDPWGRTSDDEDFGRMPGFERG